MSGSEMDVHIGAHTARRARERGTSIDEISEVLRSGSSIPAKYGRMAKSKVFDFGKERNGVFYKQKRVEVYYTIEEHTIVTITAYVFYGQWEA